MTQVVNPNAQFPGYDWDVAALRVSLGTPHTRSPPVASVVLVGAMP